MQSLRDYSHTSLHMSGNKDTTFKEYDLSSLSES